MLVKYVYYQVVDYFKRPSIFLLCTLFHHKINYMFRGEFTLNLFY